MSEVRRERCDRQVSDLIWDDTAYDERLRLTNIGSSLPYHTHVDPKVIVSRSII
jgi:hypothetical protein